jgi:hypothetical protein
VPLTSLAWAALQLGDPLQQPPAEDLALGRVQVPAQLRDDQGPGVAHVLAEDLHEHADLGVEAAVGGDHGGELDHQQVQQVVLLQLASDLAVVAAAVVADGRVQQLVLDGDVGGKGLGDGLQGAVLPGVAALGVLVGGEPPLDPAGGQPRPWLRHPRPRQRPCEPAPLPGWSGLGEPPVPASSTSTTSNMTQ